MIGVATKEPSAQELAEELAQALHDLAQPFHALGTLTLAIRMALEKGDPEKLEKAKNWSKDLGHEVERAGTLIKDLQKRLAPIRPTKKS